MAGQAKPWPGPMYFVQHLSGQSLPEQDLPAQGLASGFCLAMPCPEKKPCQAKLSQGQAKPGPGQGQGTLCSSCLAKPCLSKACLSQACRPRGLPQGPVAKPCPEGLPGKEGQGQARPGQGQATPGPGNSVQHLSGQTLPGQRPAWASPACQGACLKALSGQDLP